MADCATPALDPVGMKPTQEESVIEDDLLRAITDTTALPLHTVTLNDTSILAIAVYQERGLLFAGTQDGTIFVWDLVTQQLQATLIGHTRSVLALELAAENGWLFSASSDSTVRLWNVRELEPLALIYPATDNTGDIFTMTWCSALHTLYLGCQDTSIQWICITPEKLSETPLHAVPESRPHKFFDSMSRAMAGASSPLPLAVRTAEQLIRRTAVHMASSVATDAHPHQPMRACAPMQMSVLAVNKTCVIPSAHFGYVYSLTIVPVASGAPILASGAGDEMIRLWTLSADGILLQHTLELPLPTGDAILTLGAWESTLLAGKQGGTIDVWDIDSRTLIRTLRGHTDDVLCMQLAEPGAERTFFSGSADGHVCRWDKYFRCTARWVAHDDIVQTCAVYSGHRAATSRYSWLTAEPVLITGSSDACVRLWSFEPPAAVPAASEEAAAPPSLVQRLARFIRYKSVSNGPTMQADDENMEDSRQAAHFLKTTLMELGASDVRLVSGGARANPMVLGTFRASKGPARRRCLFYGHYDCIPASGEWDSNPWELSGRNGYLYGRGVSDNKGPVLAVAYAASELLHAKELNVDVVMLVEGEQETGSKGFQACLREHKELIGKIVCISSHPGRCVCLQLVLARRAAPLSHGRPAWCDPGHCAHHRPARRPAFGCRRRCGARADDGCTFFCSPR